jgi:hypothetical protein
MFATRTGKAMNPSNVRRDIWTKLVQRAGIRQRDRYSLRHTFASLDRVAAEEAFNVARTLGIQPRLRVIQGGKSPDVGQPLENQVEKQTSTAATV